METKRNAPRFIEDEPVEFVAHADLSGYVVLAGVWFILGSLYLFIAFSSPGRGAGTGAAVTLGVGLMWCCWLSGFRIRVSEHNFEYRNGFYKSCVFSLRNVTKAKNTWISWKLIGRAIPISRLVIVVKNENYPAIAIHTKPFSKKNIKLIMEILNASPNIDKS